jgi:hypothetical protein
MRKLELYVKTLTVLCVNVVRYRNGEWVSHAYANPYKASVQRLQKLVENLDAEVSGLKGVLVLTFSF